LQSKPCISHENYDKPILVLQPANVKMTPKYYSEKVFKKLGSVNKKYIEIKNAPHFPTEKDTMMGGLMSLSLTLSGSPSLLRVN
jgi:fermentation-respiration switch protein FrsA (DUF1100 family)